MYVNEWTVDYGPRGREAVGPCSPGRPRRGDPGAGSTSSSSADRRRPASVSKRNSEADRPYVLIVVDRPPDLGRGSSGRPVGLDDRERGDPQRSMFKRWGGDIRRHPPNLLADPSPPVRRKWLGPDFVNSQSSDSTGTQIEVISKTRMDAVALESKLAELTEAHRPIRGRVWAKTRRSILDG